jgi:hypothetical protein
LLNDMANSGGNSRAGERSEIEPHEEFLELGAVSTSGDLTEEEQKDLQAHLARCAECRQALREFEAAADIGVPFLSSKLSVTSSEESGLFQGEMSAFVLPKVLGSAAGQNEPGISTSEEKRGIAFAHRRPDKEQALNLGIFFQDNTAKKRWVLKFDDPKALDQIDAVFVTVEPNGGSHMPSGKPLLFAYLKVEPNHP